MKKHTKKLISFFVAAVLIFSAASATITEGVFTLSITASAVSSGKYGEQLTWTFSDDGTLTLSGTGPMQAYGELPWSTFNNSIIKLVISEGITVIESYAFSHCQNLASVVFSTTLEEIGHSAFLDCTSLTKIDLSKCTKLKTISAYAFNGCKKLSDITINLSSLIYVGNNAFYDTLLKKTVNNAEYVGNILVGVLSDEAVFIPKADTSVIAENSFSSLANLQKADFSGCNNLRVVCERAFFNCTKLKTIDFLNCTKLKTLDYYSFYDCTELTDINFAGCTELTNVEEYAFYGCSKLTSLNFSDCAKLKEVEGSAFSSCSLLTRIVVSKNNPYMKSVDGVLFTKDEKTLIMYPSNKPEKSYTIPAGVEVIGNEAFFSAKNLENVNFSLCNDLAEIRAMAFYASKLKEVNLSGHNNLRYIGTSAFEGNNELTKVNLSNCTKLNEIGPSAFYNDFAITSFSIENLPELIYIQKDSISNYDTLCEYKDGAYYLGTVLISGGKNVTSVTVKKDTTAIAAEAFYGNTELKQVSFAECTKLKCIFFGAFGGCEKLVGVDLKDCSSLNAIWYGAFSGCTSLSSLKLPKGDALEYIGSGICEQTLLISTASNYKNNVLSVDGCIISCDYEHINKNYTVPADTRIIAEGVFAYCSNLENISFSECKNLLSICNMAFLECENLSSVDLSGLTKLKYIYNEAFYGCGKIKSVNLSGCTSLNFLGNGTFEENKMLTQADLSGCLSLNAIESFTFAECNNLSKVSFLGCSALNTIYGNAFDDCKMLKSVDFTGCKELAEIRIEAFDKCTSLTALNFSDCTKLAKIGEKAFRSCSALSKINFSCGSQKMTVAENAFDKKIPFTYEHNYGTWTVLTPSTVLNNGTEQRVCSVCNNKETRQTPKLVSDKIIVLASEKIKQCSDNNYIAVCAGTTANGLLNATKNVSEIIAIDGKKTVSSDEKLSTGMLVVLKSGDKIIDKKTLILPGDIDGTGDITAADARLALRSAVGLVTLSNISLTSARVSGAKAVSSADARLILRAAVGLENPDNWVKLFA